MADASYTQKLSVSGSIFYDLPRNIVLPTDNALYAIAPMKSHYTLFKASNWIYGDVDHCLLLLACNGLTNPYDFPKLKSFKFLMPQFVNQISYE